MKTRKHDTHWMVGVALMAAIVVLLANTPLGMIQLPIIKATTVHIPVILGAILFGPLAGSILGGVFGICSMVSNTVAPTLLSFAFSPFVAASNSGTLGALKALWIAVGCRVMIGLVAGWLWIGLKKVKAPDLIALPIVGFVGSMTNTAFVMGSIYFLLRPGQAVSHHRRIRPGHGHGHRLRCDGGHCRPGTGHCHRQGSAAGSQPHHERVRCG